MFTLLLCLADNHSKVIPIGELHAEKIDEAVFLLYWHSHHHCFKSYGCFFWMGGFCLFVELNLWGSLPAACTARLFILQDSRFSIFWPVEQMVLLISFCFLLMVWPKLKVTLKWRQLWITTTPKEFIQCLHVHTSYALPPLSKWPECISQYTSPALPHFLHSIPPSLNGQNEFLRVVFYSVLCWCIA